MKKLSIGAKLAWQIGSWEAVSSKKQFIDIEHLLIGLSSLSKVTGSRISENAVAQFRAERTAVDNVIKSFGITPSFLRRKVRGKMGSGTFVHNAKIVHRNEDSKNSEGRDGPRDSAPDRDEPGGFGAGI